MFLKMKLTVDLPNRKKNYIEKINQSLYFLWSLQPNLEKTIIQLFIIAFIYEKIKPYVHSYWPWDEQKHLEK